MFWKRGSYHAHNSICNSTAVLAISTNQSNDDIYQRNKAFLSTNESNVDNQPLMQ